MVRIELAAADSLAAIRARSRFGIAIAAMIRMIATTINNSISEKPFGFRILVLFLVLAADALFFVGRRVFCGGVTGEECTYFGGGRLVCETAEALSSLNCAYCLNWSS